MTGFDTLELTMQGIPDTVLALSDTEPVETKGGYRCQFANYAARYDCKHRELHFGQSIQKAVDGQNVKCDIDKQRLKVAEVSDLIHYDLKQAYVDRVDVSCTIESPYSFELLKPLFGDMPEWDRQEAQNSIYYNQNRPLQNSVYVIYDKVKELRARREPVPLFCNGANMLRLEHRTFYKKRPRVGYSIASTRLSSLMDTSYWRVQTKKLLRLKDVDIRQQLSLQATNSAEAKTAIMLQLIGHVPSATEIREAAKAVRLYNGKGLDKYTLYKSKTKVLSMFATDEIDIKQELLNLIKAEL